ncbi:MAG: glycosyltransferase family 4 protein [Vulcanimicrobiaceae bacterium]
MPSDPRIAFRECGTLAQAGYDVVLIAAGSVKDLPQGVRLRSVPLPRGRFERMTRTIWQVYRAALDERADIYHFHDPELMFVGLALRLTGASVVFDVHEDIPLDIVCKAWIPRVLRGPISRASVLALRMLHHGYSAVVAATPSIARHFVDRNTVVVRNYPAMEELPKGGADFTQRPEAAVYLGYITELRGIAEMVGAMASPKLGERIRLSLAGVFESEELERDVRAMPGWRRVDFSGWCHRSEVQHLLGAARVGLLVLRPTASFADSLPTKLYEYMGAGLPVIVSDFLRCSALVREFDCGLVVDPYDIDAVARAITELVCDPARAQAMGERGRLLVSERYRWETEGSKLRELYAGLT